MDKKEKDNLTDVVEIVSDDSKPQAQAGPGQVVNDNGDVVTLGDAENFITDKKIDELMHKLKL